jgi:hypothetical protein
LTTIFLDIPSIPSNDLDIPYCHYARKKVKFLAVRFPSPVPVESKPTESDPVMPFTEADP